MNFLQIFGCALLMMMQLQFGHCLRMKRSQGDAASDYNGNSSSGTIATVVLAPTNGSVTSADPTSTTSSKQKITAGPELTTELQGKTTKATTSSALAAAASTSTTSPSDAGKMQQVEDPMGLHRPKRRLGGLLGEGQQPHQLHHKRRQPWDAVATTLLPPMPPIQPMPPKPPKPPSPYVYYNKLVSPDGKHEVKEFELLAPNMVIESVQQELNYGPEVLPPELAGVLLLNAAENAQHAVHNSAPLKQQHHHKHKSSPALPPMLYMLQQLLQPPFEGSVLVEPPREAQHRVSSPLSQFLDNAMDLALRSNPDVIEHLLGDHLELEQERDKLKSGKDKTGPKKVKKDKEKADPFPPKEELVVSCPIHHEHHANRNGEMVEDDVVLVNECHLV
ncbi:bromodomain-containing protein 4 [Drosophila gunungcola]|uniref:Uncharacterized protein n=1 Tax=Drosophila gunungcola TaxID=103775 RepID=A0A9Q0BKL2_9MUSC|nr:bromodomain-containing protein 4 [Drosophila gunungcola]XP_052843126.1 bromodomain-containing protein 4 [Drosophila gunungcola]KAI8035942.1 hypothetical protein M5D96_011373 [Drosophila gunungcola]